MSSASQCAFHMSLLDLKADMLAIPNLKDLRANFFLFPSE